MRITHLCLVGSITDGWSYQENLLCKYHARLDNEVSIITSRWVYDKNHQLYRFNKGDYYIDNNIHVVRLDLSNTKNPTYRLKKFSGVTAALEKTDPQVIFIHGLQFLDITKIVKYLRFHNDIVVYVDNHADRFNSANNILTKILHRTVWRYCARIIAPYTKMFYGVTPSRCDFLRTMYGISSSQIELLVMGADDELVLKAELNKNATKLKYKIEDNDFLIVTGGKIDKWKYQTLNLMKAVREINNPKLRLIVFGSIDSFIKSEVIKLVDNNLVQFAGWLNNDDCYCLFSIAQLVVFPGHHSVYWEQVAGIGVPMLVKDLPGFHHVDKNGNVEFLYSSSVEEIKKKIKQIYADRNKYSKMMNAAKQCADDFSYMQIATRSVM